MTGTEPSASPCTGPNALVSALSQLLIEISRSTIRQRAGRYRSAAKVRTEDKPLYATRCSARLLPRRRVQVPTAGRPGLCDSTSCGEPSHAIHPQHSGAQWRSFAQDPKENWELVAAAVEAPRTSHIARNRSKLFASSCSKRCLALPEICFRIQAQSFPGERCAGRRPTFFDLLRATGKSHGRNLPCPALTATFRTGNRRQPARRLPRRVHILVGVYRAGVAEPGSPGHTL